VPYYVVNARNSRGGVTSRATHIMKSGSASTPGMVSAAVVGYGKQTLCGQWAGRYVDVFQPSEASCRECRKRWQVATTKEAAMTPEQRQARDKAEAGKRAAGCLVILLIILGIILFAILRPHSASAAQPILSKIPGCGNISTTGGYSLHDNTVAEGSCYLSDGTSLKIYVWSAGDISDQHNFVYWDSSNCTSSTAPSLNAPDGCFVGSSPMPWFIKISTSNFAMSGAESDWTPVENALSGVQVTTAPASWCSGACPLPGQHAGSGGIHFGDGD
jgi:hypothetical protein